jgi:hypothetical protein
VEQQALAVADSAAAVMAVAEKAKVEQAADAVEHGA